MEQIDIVRRFIGQRSLLHQEGRYLVALSGGADSVALLLILRELGYRVEAVHCNFRLRGAESDRDEQFCSDLCERLGVEFHRVHFDTRFYAEQHHVSIEMAARELRYHYFARLCQAVEADGICVAHHQDDSVETVVMNLIRGTGVQGLLGIQPVNGKIIRPLLCLTRQQVEDYLQQVGQPFVTDSTNQEDDAVRNQIRHHILPLMEQINPAAKQNIARMTGFLKQVADVYQEVIRGDAASIRQHRLSADGECPYDAIAIDQLLKVRQPHDTLLYILREYGFRPVQVEAVWQHIHTATGKMFETDDWQLVFDRGELLIAERQKEVFGEYRFPIEGHYRIGNGKQMDIVIGEMTPDAVSKLSQTATLDADKVSFPLRLRSIKKGDCFQPFGMKGMKLVSDFLTDRKMPLFLKHRQIVVEDAQGRIVWLVGQRTDHRFRVTDDTRRVLRMAFKLPET